MSIKLDLTKYVADQLGLETDQKNIQGLKRLWWRHTKDKPKGGLRLTEKGFESLKAVDIKFHKITIEKDLIWTNQMTIWLDNFIDCPWFLTNLEIWVTTEKMAIQLVLFSGDVQKFLYSKAQSIKSS